MILEPKIENTEKNAKHLPLVEIEKWEERNGAIIEIEVIGTEEINQNNQKIDSIKIEEKGVPLGKIEISEKLEPRVTFFLKKLPNELTIISNCKKHGKSKTHLKDIKKNLKKRRKE